MKTEIIIDDIDRAAQIIAAGGLVAVPTETVYGLAANGLDECAVHRIYEVKGRPEVKPLALMVAGADAMDEYCAPVPPQARLLAEKFWPGPLTIVMQAKDTVPNIVRAGGTTVGLRCPAHELTLAALKAAKLPFAAPSANPSGEASPKNAHTVLDYFDGKIDAVIDGGECGIGHESTLIDMSAAPYKILRQGALDRGAIANALAEGVTIVGITGGTGSGKTTALNTLAELGALVIDCDALYHELLHTDAGLVAAIDAKFPGAVIDGAVDTKALGRIVFADEVKLQALNELTRSFILNAVHERVCDHAMRGGTLAAIDAIELFSSGAADMCNVTFGVIADREVRLARIQQRDNISREYAELRVSAQHPDEYFIAHCDHILHNNGTKEEFSDCCMKIFTEVLKNE